MKIRTRLFVSIPLLVALCSATLGYAESLRTVTGLNYIDKERAFDGYTLFAALGDGTTYLLDMEGNVVNSWPITGNPRLLDNGNLLAGSRGRFTELDWDGDIVWSYEETRSNYVPHHDFVRRYNPKLGEMTTFYIANRDVSQEECVAMGCDPANDYTGASIDTIVEINMDGEIIWEWRFVDHMVQDRYPDKANYVGEGKTIADYPGRLNVHIPGAPVRRDWVHLNSVDYNSELDQVTFSAVYGEVYIIDHGATFVPGDPEQSIALAAGPSGDFLWRFGDPARYEQGDRPHNDAVSPLTPLGQDSGHKQTGGVHDIQWIDEGLPGAGKILLFNNGHLFNDHVPQSYVYEINPYLDADGNDTGQYVNPPDAGYYLWESEARGYYAQGFEKHIQSGRLDVPLTRPPKLLQSHRIGRSSSAERQHVYLRVHHGPSFRGDGRRRSRLGIYSPRDERRSDRRRAYRSNADGQSRLPSVSLWPRTSGIRRPRADAHGSDRRAIVSEFD
ncbi:MAG: aryl-sulfate sulfotransferase [Candidatus Rariloculaceae bacterium]